MSKRIDWKDCVLIDAYPECSNVGLSYDDLYKEFKKRHNKEMGKCMCGKTFLPDTKDWSEPVCCSCYMKEARE